MKEIRFNLPDSLADKFELAIQLSGDNRDAIGEKFVRDYLASALQNVANEFRTPDPVPQPPLRNAEPAAQTAQQDTAAPQPAEETDSPFRRNTTGRQGYWQEWGKAINRIPRWARNPQQNNHKILRAFFELQKEMNHVSIDALRRRCSDPVGHPDTYVPHFDNNFTQMKFDNGNSHGKVFEEKDGFITIWDRLSDTVQKYRDYFL